MIEGIEKCDSDQCRWMIEGKGDGRYWRTEREKEFEGRKDITERKRK
jgi:hypothetical protein